MNIICTPLYEQQIKAIVDVLALEDIKQTQPFKLYLDTIILNVATKAKKYKPSIYFDDESIRDIEHQGYTIPFLWLEDEATYVILGIMKKESFDAE